MANYTHIIFDLDGTLTDPREGIGNSIRYALEKMHIDNFSGIMPEQFIGPPLQEALRRMFGLNEKDTNRVVQYFREYYSAKGKFENRVYPGVMELLESLYSAGKEMCMATAKLEKFAVEISSHFGFDKYIKNLKGADYKGEKATKDVVIAELLKDIKCVGSKSVVMVGDTLFDMEGGKKNGLSTIAVTYGFGKEEDLRKTDPDAIAGSAEDLHDLLV